ncbi:unnamed protein product [Onchocerca flexuosa]|uniref:Transmembrane protein n=1 Tax=Onchocerca flexuosa TaxID=387005 RepID=A0A183HBB2_9BILA|nr:unnamed protein product [Onchocerca flexuosa]
MLSTLMKCSCKLTTKSPKLVFFQPIRSRFGLNKKEKYRRRIDEFKENIEQSKQKLPYQEDVIPLRPLRDLYKAFGFTVGVGVISFAVAAIFDLKRSNNRYVLNFLRFLFFLHVQQKIFFILNVVILD